LENTLHHDQGMKTKTSAGGMAGCHLGFHPKMRMNRIRTCSSDSGCDMVTDSPDLNYTIMEDAVQTWASRLEGVVRQEVDRCREVTDWAREAMRHAASNQDEARKEEVMMAWRCQLEGIMEFTKDLIDCVNNDTKELMYDSTGSSGHESTIDEMIEDNYDDDDDDKEEEIMKLFLLSAMGGGRNGNKKSRNGKKFRNSRKANKEVQTAYARIKRHESFAKRRLSWEETKFVEDNETCSDFHYSEKMFGSVMDYPEIFNDWYWNLDEDNDDVELIFEDWKWNLEMTEDLKKVFYDDPNTETDYNEFNYWRVDNTLKIDLDSGCLADSEDDCRTWTDCMFWQDGNDNWNIIHNLVNDVVVDDDDDNQFFHNYWDENTANQSIIKSLLDDEDEDDCDDGDDISEVANDEFIWEERETLVALIDFMDENENVLETEENFLWNDQDVLFSLLETEDELVDKPNDDVFPWEEPKFLRALLETEDDTVENTDDFDDFLWNNPDFARSLVAHEEDLITFSDENEDRTWTTWPFWNKIGSFQEIVEAYEVCFAKNESTMKIPSINIEEVFWEICLDDSNSAGDAQEKNEGAIVPKDPVNIFKSIRHIFNVPKEAKKKNKNKSKFTIDENHLYDDMEDIYGEWAAIALDDDRAEKKRQSRGRKKSKNHDSNNNKIVGNRRTPTPTIQMKQTKYFDLDSCWIDAKKPNKERRTAFARNQKRLNAKMFAKQPRKIT